MYVFSIHVNVLECTYVSSAPAYIEQVLDNHSCLHRDLLPHRRSDPTLGGPPDDGGQDGCPPPLMSLRPHPCLLFVPPHLTR
jgi:hypothetical protein